MTRSRGTILVAGLLVLVGLGASARNASLIDAVKRDDAMAVRALVRQGVDVNAASPDGSTVLHWAVHRGDRELVALLIRSGARVATANRYGITPIGLAAENGDAAILEALLKAGAAANLTQSDGDTPIMIAARTGRTDAIRTLLAHGATVNDTNKLGQTALMFAAARNNGAAVRVLAEAGAKVNARTTDGVENKPGQRRADAEDSRTMAAPPTGFSALLFAVRSGSTDAVRALVEAGANINDTVSDGQSALVLATANAHWQLADWMLDHGANPNLADAGWNALHQAVRIRRPNTGFGTPGPLASGTVDSLEVIKKMLAKGAAVNARMTTNGMKDGQRNRLIRTGATAFFLAAKNTDMEAMRVLLAAGADANIPNGELSTPIMVAAGLHIWNPGEDGGSLPGQEPEVLDAVKTCVEQGNDVNAANIEGWTALHGAAFRGVNSVVEFLVGKGAKLDAKTMQGWTPWSIAHGLTYSEFYKHQPHTAALLSELMQKRGLSTDGQDVDPKVCLDCGRMAAEYAQREKKASERVAADIARAR